MSELPDTDAVRHVAEAIRAAFLDAPGFTWERAEHAAYDGLKNWLSVRVAAGAGDPQKMLTVEQREAATAEGVRAATDLWADGGDFDAAVGMGIGVALGLAKGEPIFEGCPCTLTTPCDPSCTCVDPFSSRGCIRCCKYGSLEQRHAQAERLAFFTTVTSGAGDRPTELAIADAAFAARDAGWQRLCLKCLQGFNGTDCPKCAGDRPPEGLAERLLRDAKQLPPEARRVLYENLWELYVDDPAHVGDRPPAPSEQIIEIDEDGKVQFPKNCPECSAPVEWRQRGHAPHRPHYVLRDAPDSSRDTERAVRPTPRAALTVEQLADALCRVSLDGMMHGPASSGIPCTRCRAYAAELLPRLGAASPAAALPEEP